MAVKVLPQQVAADAERLARFERDAKVIARGALPVDGSSEPEALARDSPDQIPLEWSDDDLFATC